MSAYAQTVLMLRGIGEKKVRDFDVPSSEAHVACHAFEWLDIGVYS
jgi:hypothetical protein